MGRETTSVATKSRRPGGCAGSANCHPRFTVLDHGGLLRAVRDCHERVYISAPLRRNALLMTDTELRLMAAAAMMGLSKMPNTG